MQKFSVISLAMKIPTEAAAYEYLENLRWNGHPVCPHCGVIDGHYYLTPKNGLSRETSSGKMSERRMWKCCACRKQFSATTGTVMHGSHVPIRIWLFIFFEMAGNKNGIAAREIERKYGVNPRTAWHITQRIREAMSGNDGELFVGNVSVDEAYIGGKPSNRHGHDGTATRGAGADKIAVVSVVDVDNGKVHSSSLGNNNVDSTTLGNVIRSYVDKPIATLHTDSLSAYVPVGKTMAGHFVVNHRAGIYATDKTTGTNKVENYFSQLKRSLDGTHHGVSPKHLHRYLGEFDYRFNTRDISDQDRMTQVVQRTAGRRLSYADLKGRRSIWV